MPDDAVAALKSLPLFSKADDAVLRRVAGLCRFRDYDAGQEIVGYLDGGTDVYFVLSGTATVRIYSPQGRVVGFRDIGPGDIFGEFSALDHGPRSASVECTAPARVAMLTSADFCRLVDETPQISRALIGHLVAQLRTLTARVFEFSTLGVAGRIEAELHRIAQMRGRSVDRQPNKVHIDSPPTHNELASLLSTHREAISRHLSHLSRHGIIRRSGRTLVIEDFQRLTEMVRGSKEM